jgi:hypothetical protein
MIERHRRRTGIYGLYLFYTTRKFCINKLNLEQVG